MAIQIVEQAETATGQEVMDGAATKAAEMTILGIYDFPIAGQAAMETTLEPAGRLLPPPRARLVLDMFHCQTNHFFLSPMQ
jgi:hypothetical protein